jgi:hypothetical protein
MTTYEGVNDINLKITNYKKEIYNMKLAAEAANLKDFVKTIYFLLYNHK